MSYTRRRLPHWLPDETPIFVTWRLAGSMPKSKVPAIPSQSYLEREEQFDLAIGPTWLADSWVAGMVGSGLQYGESERHFYDLHAWVIMPTHVHMIIRPRGDLAAIMRWLKGRTGRKANAILGKTGVPFCVWSPSITGFDLGKNSIT